MSFFERLKAASETEWRSYIEHPFTNAMADGSLPEPAFQYYLVQDYLFPLEFARAYTPQFTSRRASPTCVKGRRGYLPSERRDGSPREALRRLGPVAQRTGTSSSGARDASLHALRA